MHLEAADAKVKIEKTQKTVKLNLCGLLAFINRVDLYCFFGYNEINQAGRGALYGKKTQVRNSRHGNDCSPFC